MFANTREALHDILMTRLEQPGHKANDGYLVPHYKLARAVLSGFRMKKSPHPLHCGVIRVLKDQPRTG